MALNGEKDILIAFQQRGGTVADVYMDAHTTQLLSLSVNVCHNHNRTQLQNIKHSMKAVLVLFKFFITSI